MNKIIFSTPFTGKTPKSDMQTQTWFDYRAEIFGKFTLKSLMNQIDKDFLIWLQFRPEDKNNEATKRITNELNNSGLKYILTFDGPIMMEDRATWHNKDLIERATKSLKKLEPIKEDYVIEVGLDSDDMVDEHFVEFLKNKVPKENSAYYMNKGFVYSTTDRLSDWNNPESMSIYAIGYPTDIFLDAKKHFEHQKGFSSHEQIPKLFDAELLPDGFYCAGINGMNISTIWNHPFRGREYLYEDEKKEILKRFGVIK